MKILKKILKLIIYLVSIISLIILGGNIKYCSNQNKEKKEAVHQIVRKKALNYSEEWTKYYQVPVRYLAEDYKYLAVNLSNGEVLTLNDDYTYDETLIQGNKNYPTTNFIKSIPNIISNREEEDNPSISYFEFQIEYYLVGTEIQNSQDIIMYYNFMLFNNSNDFYILGNDKILTDYRGDAELYKIVSDYLKSEATIFNSNYNDIYLILSTNYGTGFSPSYMDFFINYSSFFVETETSDYYNLYNDFIDLKYQEEYSEIIGQLEADNQGLTEENRSLYNQIQALEQENERLQQEYDEAYDLGLAEGQEQAFSIINFLERILLMLDSILNVEILPYIRLWYIVAIPMLIGVVKMVLSWFK